MASFTISHKVVAQTEDSRTLTALLYAWLLDLHDSITQALREAAEASEQGKFASTLPT